MVTWMLDTNILLYRRENRPSSVATRIDALNDEDLLRTSFVTHAELLEGAQRSARKAAVLERLNALTRLAPVAYPSSSAISEHYAVQSTVLKTSKTPTAPTTCGSPATHSPSEPRWSRTTSASSNAWTVCRWTTGRTDRVPDISTD